jgi:hypothetical protein
MHAAGPGPKSRAFNGAVIAESGQRRQEHGRDSGRIYGDGDDDWHQERDRAHRADRSGSGRCRLIIVGSSGGLPLHPQWYHHILANPRVTVEWLGETFPAKAIVPKAPIAIMSSAGSIISFMSASADRPRIPGNRTAPAHGA